MSSSWTKMSLRITDSSLTAEQLSGLVGIPPARRIEAGQQISPRSPNLHKQSFCIYDSPLPAEVSPEEHFVWAIDLLKIAGERLAAVQPAPEIDIRLGISLNGQCSWALTATELAFLGALNVQVNFDLYLSEPESEA